MGEPGGEDRFRDEERFRIEARIIVMKQRTVISSTTDALDAAGIPTQVVSAVDGREFDASCLDLVLQRPLVTLRLGEDPSPGMIGCWLSHRRCYEELATDPHDLAALLILEDDVEVPKGFRIDSVAQRLLDTEAPVIVHFFSRGISAAHPCGRQQVTSGVYFRHIIPPGQTAAYAINRAAADLAVASKLMDGPADWPSWAQSVQFWGVFPWPVRELPIPSTIEVPTQSRTKAWVRTLRRVSGLDMVSVIRAPGGSFALARQLWMGALLGLMRRIRQRANPGGDDTRPLFLRSLGKSTPPEDPLT